MMMSMLEIKTRKENNFFIFVWLDCSVFEAETMGTWYIKIVFLVGVWE